MHPVMTEKLAAEQIREMVARGDAARRARDAHRARHDQRVRGRRAAAGLPSAGLPSAGLPSAGLPSAGRRDAGRPAADWTPTPVISARSADGAGR
jgi:hypothetical protein